MMESCDSHLIINNCMFLPSTHLKQLPEVPMGNLKISFSSGENFQQSESYIQLPFNCNVTHGLWNISLPFPTRTDSRKGIFLTFFTQDSNHGKTRKLCWHKTYIGTWDEAHYSFGIFQWPLIPLTMISIWTSCSVW